jgi:D-glycero-D-manno-heptose 1,7-bisphosphate phosphatase
MRPAVILDRDGTLCHEVHYLRRPDQLRLFDGAAVSMRRLREAGFALVLVTNQSGVARGYFSEDDVAAVHRALQEELAAAGAGLDAVYYCPHHPRQGSPAYRTRCRCRKPGTALLEQAQAELGLDLARSYAVGDRLRDLEGALRLGCRGFLVRTGYGRREEGRLRQRRLPVEVVDDLAAAACRILEDAS